MVIRETVSPRNLLAVLLTGTGLVGLVRLGWFAAEHVPRYSSASAEWNKLFPPTSIALSLAIGIGVMACLLLAQVTRRVSNPAAASMYGVLLGVIIVPGWISMAWSSGLADFALLRGGILVVGLVCASALLFVLRK